MNTSSTNGHTGQARTMSAEEMLKHMAKDKATGADGSDGGSVPVDEGSEAVPVDFALDPKAGQFLLTVTFDPDATYRRPYVKGKAAAGKSEAQRIREGRWGFNRIIADTGWAAYDLGDGYAMEFRLTRKSDEARTTGNSGLRSAVRRK